MHPVLMETWVLGQGIEPATLGLATECHCYLATVVVSHNTGAKLPVKYCGARDRMAVLCGVPVQPARLCIEANMLRCSNAYRHGLVFVCYLVWACQACISLWGSEPCFQ